MKQFKNSAKEFLIALLLFLFFQSFLFSYRLPDYLFEDNISQNFLNKIEENIKVSIIIDDIGRNYKTAKEIWNINKNITLSILPFLKYSKKISEYAYQHHLPVMLHFPMEPFNYKNKLESFFLLSDMNENEFYSTTIKVLNSIPYYQGINNHMGSKLTSNYNAMERFFKIIKFKNVFFIDSRTSPFSVAAKVALKYGILTGIRDIFLDNELNVAYILNQLEKLYKLGERKGYAIAIGHPHKQTIEALKIFFKNKKHFQIISVKRGLLYFKNYEKALVLRKEIQ